MDNGRPTVGDRVIALGPPEECPLFSRIVRDLPSSLARADSSVFFHSAKPIVRQCHLGLLAEDHHCSRAIAQIPGTHA